MTGTLIAIGLFVLHWYLSLWMQSFFHHRYAAHGMFRMSRFWEKTFHVVSFVFQGASYLSPYAYGVMHRLHHAYADTEKDPHSPQFDDNPFKMMWRTRQIYMDIDYGKMKDIPKKFFNDVPKWRAFDHFAELRVTRFAWILIYILVYILIGPEHWWVYLLIPLHVIMGPLHGVIINWFAHTIGYRNFKVKDTSKNIFPIDLLMLGEGLHNNHHKFGGRPKFSVKWYEFDPLYPVIWLKEKLGIIQFKRKPETEFM